MATNPTIDPFAALAAEQFVVLTTYRRDGTPVPTTVWFAAGPGTLFVTTGAQAGKIKRIRHNGQVTLAPSDRVGNLLGGPTVPGLAHEATGDERTQARAALAAKYGAQFTQIAGEESLNRTYIVIVSGA